MKIADNLHYGHVYIVTNKKNGKVYVGQKKGMPCTKYMGSGENIKNKIKSFRVGAFQKEKTVIKNAKSVALFFNALDRYSDIIVSYEKNKNYYKESKN